MLLLMKVVNRSPQFPPHFSDAFAKEEILANYLHVGRNEEHLQWVMKLVKASSVLPIPIESTVVYERFFTNPLSMNDPSVYAVFPWSAKPVMNFILQNQDLFQKKFITFFPRDITNVATCFIK